jgi:hypothetical protein
MSSCFGSERKALTTYVPLLKDLQRGDCFYCGGSLRYPIDRGHNFVLAHSGCNKDKRGTLAGVRHLEKWVGRNHQHVDKMRSYFDGEGLVYNLKASESVAAWAYDQTEASGGSVWIAKDVPLEELGCEWRRVL